LLAFSTCLALAACGSSSTAPQTTNDAATDTASVDAGPDNVVDHGTVIDYGSGNPVKNITVAEVGVTGTTDASGMFALTVPKNKLLNLVLTGADYTKTIIGEQSFSTDFDRAEIPIPQLGLFHVAQASLDGYDTAKGIVYLLVEAIGTCKDVAGGTVTVKAPADAKAVYFKEKFPDAMQTSFVSTVGHLPVAAIYNVPPGAALDVTITHPTCKQKPFPAVVAGTTYTGKVDVEAGDSNSVAFYFLE
jgi:hypothetical protein